ncbi:MAG: hypothetical protein AB8B79_23255 [Granulosicoccus sp.]
MKVITFSSIKPCIAAVATLFVLSSCASSNDGLRNVGSAIGSKSSRVSICKSGDTQIDSASQCLQDDAACYELNTGKWCTGERGNTCPSGSVALSSTEQCPAGKRCFSISESLRCTII